MNFPYELAPLIHEEITIIDKVLTNLGRPGFCENPDFEIDHNSSGYFELMATVRNTRSAHVPLVFLLMGNGLRIDLDGIQETFEWSEEQVNNRKHVISGFIRLILTCFLVIEYRNGSIWIQFFGASGQLENNLKVRSGPIIGILKERSFSAKLFHPVYEVP